MYVSRKLVWFVIIFLSGCIGASHEVHVSEERGPMPVISALVFTKTDSTIVATWTTDVPADSNLSAGGKAAIDNGIAANSTSHQAIVTGLLPSTLYSCIVTSGSTSSTPQNVTTNALQTRVLVTSAKNGTVTLGNEANNQSDTQRTFLSNDNKVYVTQDDGYGIVLGNRNAGFATQVAALSDETAFTGGPSLLTNYGAAAEFDGTDGPGGVAMSNKSSGIFGLNGNLHMFVYRQLFATADRYSNVIKSTNHGATWNNFTAPATFVAGGVQVSPHSPAEPVQFTPLTAGLVFPIRYAADDGTLGYNTAGNQIDGANAYVYCNAIDIENSVGPYLMRIPRITFDLQTMAGTQYWHGPSFPSPLQFTDDTNWSSSSSGATVIWTGSAQVPSPTVGTGFPYGSDWVDITFIPAMNSYVLTQTTYSNTQFQFYSAPTPAGPWTLFFTQTNSTLNLQFYGPFFFHRDVVGNAVTSNAAIRMLYSAPFAGSHYAINNSVLTLNPSSGAPMIQLTSYGFTTIENPLSNGGNFSICPTYSALKVPSSGVCEATANSTDCLMYWSGVIPSGDTGGAWPADQYSEITVAALNNVATDVQYLIVRQNPAAKTFYLLVIAAVTSAPGAHTFSLDAFVAGTFHALTTFSVTVAANDVIRLSVTGNVITTTQNGTVRNTFTDASNFVPGPGAPGLGTNAANIVNSQISLWAAGANQAVSPTFSPIGGTYTGTQTVTITGPGGSTIYYTTDGSTPTRSSSSIASGGTISVATSQTVKAISSISNFADSQVTGATYVIQVATPLISPNGGSFNLPQTVTLSDSDSGLSGFAMYYTTDGSTPTISSTLYTVPFIIKTSSTVKAIAVATSHGNSAVASAAFTIVGGGGGFGGNLTYGF